MEKDNAYCQNCRRDHCPLHCPGLGSKKPAASHQTAEVSPSNSSAGLAGPEQQILGRLSEAAQVAHHEFMKKGQDGHQDEEWWHELSIEINEIIDNYL